MSLRKHLFSYKVITLWKFFTSKKMFNLKIFLILIIFWLGLFYKRQHQNGDYRDLLKNIFWLNQESDYCGYYLEPYWRRCRFRHCQTSCLVSVHSTRKWNVVFKHQRGWAGNLVSNRIWSLLFLFQTGRFRSGWHFSIMSAVGKLRSKCKSVEL